jgi:ribosomal protein S6--L-glutamate ligase
VSRLTILSSRPDLYSTRRLLEEADARGFAADVVDYRRCSLGIGATARVLYQGADLRPHVVVPRIGSRSTRYGAAVVRQLQTMGCATVTQAGAILRARDKFAAVQAMAAAGVPVPATSAARSPSGIAEVLELVGGSPVVVKLVEGTHGSGVVLAETRKAAESLLAAFHQLNADLCVQEFVADAGGRDVRAIVVDSQVVAAMERRAEKGEFRANLHQGAVAYPTELSEVGHKVAVAAAACVGLDVAGVGMLRTEAGPLVLEANVSPGLKGIEAASGVNVAGAIVAYAARLLA